MGRVAPPTRDEILRIPLDPEWAQVALERWGLEALMDPGCEDCGQAAPIRGVGLGDAIKRITKAFGVKPCPACEQRAKKLNRWRVPRRGRR